MNNLKKIQNLCNKELLHLEQIASLPFLAPSNGEMKCIFYERQQLWGNVVAQLADVLNDQNQYATLERKEIINFLGDIRDKTKFIANLWLKIHYKAEIIFQLRYISQFNVAEGRGANFVCTA